MAAANVISQDHIQISKTAARDGMEKRKHDLQHVVAVNFLISHSSPLKTSQLVPISRANVAGESQRGKDNRNKKAHVAKAELKAAARL